MATNYKQVTGLLGVNLEGNEPLAGTSDGTTGAPRVAPGTPVLISGNKAAVYGVALAALNPGATVAFENFNSNGSTMAATSATADKVGVYVTLNTATAATGDYLWARTNTYVGQ